jgi:hypothetical protein
VIDGFFNVIGSCTSFIGRLALSTFSSTSALQKQDG